MWVTDAPNVPCVRLDVWRTRSYACDSDEPAIRFLSLGITSGNRVGRRADRWADKINAIEAGTLSRLRATTVSHSSSETSITRAARCM